MSDREKGDELRDRMAARFEGNKDEEEAEEAEGDEEVPAEATQTAKSAKPAKPAKTEQRETTAGTTDTSTSVKDRPSVLMYLPEDLHTDLDVRFDELNARHKREHGKPLEKNRNYYPIVIELGLEKLVELDDDDLLARL